MTDASSVPTEPLAAPMLTRFPDGPPTQVKGVTPSHLSAEHAESKHEPKILTGKVTSAGLMSRTVRVDRPVQVWHNYLRKFYKSSKHYLVHDPANSLRKGDLISFSRINVPKGDSVSHLVRQILVPFGQNIEERPAIPSPDELKAEHEREKAAKRERRQLRRKAESGDQEAAQKVKEEGIAVKELSKGTGRGKKIQRLLERDAKK
ncbi:Hypothetical protein D9617_13g099570 [Elsinoe fawcettii]|nr:Hypothetical protein D9617_13g099570 [Elsinoe fawcettii]